MCPRRSVAFQDPATPQTPALGRVLAGPHVEEVCGGKDVLLSRQRDAGGVFPGRRSRWRMSGRARGFTPLSLGVRGCAVVWFFEGCLDGLDPAIHEIGDGRGEGVGQYVGDRLEAGAALLVVDLGGSGVVSGLEAAGDESVGEPTGAFVDADQSLCGHCTVEEGDGANVGLVECAVGDEPSDETLVQLAEVGERVPRVGWVDVDVNGSDDDCHSAMLDPPLRGGSILSVMFTIGQFSRATHLSVKALRHYDDVGLLVPAEIDPATGYRRYQASQAPTAHLIRRLRDLAMPVMEIREVVAAAYVAARDSVIAALLERMESTLARTQATVAELRLLLTPRSSARVEYREVRSTPAAVRHEIVEWDDVERWLTSTLASLHSQVEAVVPDGALYAPAFFEDHAGEVTAFVPVAFSDEVLSGGTYAVAVHQGSFDNLDETYGVLGSDVTALGIDTGGAIREHYLSDLVTAVLWPVKHTT